MLPVLFNSQGLTFYTFGVFLVLALLWGSFWLWKNIKLTSYKEEEFFDGVFLSIIGALFVGRLAYVALNFADFGFDFLKFILINGFPGLSLYGALAGAFGTFFLYSRVKKRSFLEMIDYTISPLFLALSIGALGAFLSGTMAGTKTGFLLSARYLGLDGMRHIPAIYMAILFIVAFYLTHRFLLRARRQQLAIGTNFFFFIFYFSLVNLLLDNFRTNPLYLASFSFNLVTSAILCAVTGLYFVVISRATWKKFLKKLIPKRNHDNKKSTKQDST